MSAVLAVAGGFFRGAATFGNLTEEGKTGAGILAGAFGAGSTALGISATLCTATNNYTSF